MTSEVPYYARRQRSSLASKGRVNGRLLSGVPPSLLPPELAPAQLYGNAEQSRALQALDGAHCANCDAVYSVDGNTAQNERCRVCAFCLRWRLRVVMYCSEKCQQAHFVTHRDAHRVAVSNKSCDSTLTWSDSLED